jgi:REP element-mobilizing transposase RayT
VSQHGFRGRRSIRLKNFDYASAGIYFVTICTYNRECFFGHVVDEKIELNESGIIVSSEWLRTSTVRNYVQLDEFVVMPNHFHGIIILNENVDRVGASLECPHIVNPAVRSHGLNPNSVGSIVGQFKSIATKRIRSCGTRHFRWQRNYYEHIIRNDRELTTIREYIFNNPINWWYNNENLGRQQ